MRVGWLLQDIHSYIWSWMFPCLVGGEARNLLKFRLRIVLRATAVMTIQAPAGQVVRLESRKELMVVIIGLKVGRL